MYRNSKKLKCRDNDGDLSVHLGVVVPSNNHGKKSFKDTVERYHEIFKMISSYANMHKLTVVLPKIGTSANAGRCDMCCFKNVLSQYNFHRIIIHQDENGHKTYNRTGPCQHGGYITYCNRIPSQIK